MTERHRHRLWLAICCFAFGVLSFTTRPGHLISDTKIDLALDPIRFLERAAHLWDVQHFGQLQNQVSGYLFPMGPFFAAGHLAGLPAWITQRLWITLVLCVAFLGVERLARRLEIGTPGTRIVGALAYALAPRALSIIGEISIEFLPAAMLPWILLPLLTAAETGQRGRAAVRSGVAVALCGGVNAVAVGAVLVAPVLYILTRPKPVPRWRMLGLWTAAVAVATLFWSLPLLLAGRYAFSFLPYTETASATTQVTSLTNVLRGASDWVRYLAVGGVPVQPVGYTIATGWTMIVVTGVLAALGLVGLARRDLPSRGFLTVLFLVGLAALVAGHMSVLEPIVAEPVRWLLDGPLAPLRNLRKFDPLVRLALAMGLAHLLCSVRLRLPLVKAVTAVAFAALLLPVLDRGVAAPGDFEDVPPYWREAAAWINANAGDDGVLVVPGAKFGEYVWGRPIDDPMQSLFAARWTARQVTAAGSVGLSRLLDVVDQRLAAGHGSAGLTRLLRRMGIHYLLVRNDLLRVTLQGAWPARVHEALRESPGIVRVRSFGGEVGDGFTDDVVNSVDWPFPALELYEVQDSTDVVSVAPADAALRVRGGPDSLLSMGDLGVLGDRPVLVNDDGAQRQAPTVVSDALRLRERHFGEIRTNWTQTLPADRRADFTGVRELDLLEDGWLENTATARYEGVAAVTASTSAADAEVLAGVSSPAANPWAALDGDLTTAWESSGWEPVDTEWLRMDFSGPLELSQIQISFVANEMLGPPVTRIAVDTEQGTVEHDLGKTGAAESLATPRGPSSWLRVRILDAAGEPDFGQRVGIAEIKIPSLLPGRTIDLPAAQGDAYVMDRGLDGRPACMRNQSRWICNPVLARPDEEGAGFDRTFIAAEARHADVSGLAVLRDAALVERYTSFGGDLPEVVGSSQAGEEPVAAPRSAFDGDDSTTWIAAPLDAEPTLTIDWKRPLKVSRIQVARPGGDKQPLDLVITGDKGQVRSGRADAGGRLTFRPMLTRKIQIRFLPASRRLQVTELFIPGVDPAVRPKDVPLRLRCGLGPRLEVNGHPVPTKVEGTMTDLLERRPVRFTACGGTDLREGANRVRVAGWDPYALQSLLVGEVPEAPRAGEPAAARGTWTPSVREVQVTAPEAAYLVVNENFNAGWQATLDGVTLPPVRIDGWKQGWELPAGTDGVVRLEYSPDRAYGFALVAGLVGIAILMVLALVMRGPRPEHVLETAPAGSSRAGRWRLPATIAVSLAFGFWAAGWAGMAVVPAALAAVVWGRGRLRHLDSPWVPGLAFGAATLALAAAQLMAEHGVPESTFTIFYDSVPQLAACAALGALFGSLVTEESPPRPLPVPERVPAGAGRAAAPAARPGGR
ncbi:alpha-(1-_3)-arabinofuranosyltransferase domain-containing protein [Thermoactinospora rubra]|uniref:alpha-(1->3)-arabinofuranosyltransferase domain-containing protein n=1 Tax=Thermoactinospora rubra TaxID=1088767 RepID=UPI000A104E60|nr:alpha-(1->3)-arabinofuranosyltransferase family protein [Thermoactinospora rubra]